MCPPPPETPRGLNRTRHATRPPRIVRALLLCLGIALLLMMSNVSLALAKSEQARNPHTITVTSQTQKINFPKSIDYFLSVRDADSTITQATLHISSPMDSRVVGPGVKPAKPGSVINLTWHEDMNRGNFLPPGTQVTYYWEIRDSADNTLTSAPVRFTVNDTRYTWQESDDGLVHIKSYNSDEEMTQALHTGVEEALKTITKNLGMGPKEPMTLWIYQDRKAFQSALPPDTEEWVGGIAFPDTNQGMFVVEDPKDSTLIRDMPHEMTHLILHQIANAKLEVPRWLDEGLATYNQQYHEGEMSFQLQEAMKKHSILRLGDITDSFPSDGDEAYLAYAQSWNLVKYMYTTFGMSKMHTLYRAMGDGLRSFDEDLKLSISMDSLHLENAWRIHNNQSATLTQEDEKTQTSATKQPVATNTIMTNRNLLLALGIFLLALPEISVAGYFIYRRQVRIRYEKQMAVWQAQRILNEAFADPYQPPFQPHNPNADYTDPSRYGPQNPERGQ